MNAEYTEFARETLEKLKKKLPYAIRKAQGLDFIPYTVKDGAWAPGPCDGICWWTNGFWAAEMWMMYAVTGEEQYKAEACRSEEQLDAAFADFPHLHHDVGFMWRISAGFDYELTGNQKSFDRCVFAASLLAGRFNPNGFIRAWNGDCTGWAIIDCMMNLSLLYWASEHTGDPRFRLIAQAHADTSMRAFIRPNGSSAHIVCFDPENGSILETPAGQGYATGSSWSRGQAWALYGFAISYAHTGKQEYLATSRKVADRFISQVRDDWLPRCDFDQPAEPDVRDDCAGGIAACGMISLYEALGEAEGTPYLDAAYHLLKALAEHHADWTEQSPAILTHCTGSYHGQDHHMAMNYGDYYLIEGVCRLNGLKKLRW